MTKVFLFIITIALSLVSSASSDLNVIANNKLTQKPYIVISGPTDLLEVRVNIENYKPTGRDIKKSEISFGDGIVISNKKDVYHKYQDSGSYIVIVKTWDNKNTLTTYSETVDANSKYEYRDLEGSSVFGPKDIYFRSKYEFSINETKTDKIFKLTLNKSPRKVYFFFTWFFDHFRKCDEDYDVVINDIEIFKEREVTCKTEHVERFVKLQKNNKIKFDHELFRKHNVYSVNIVQVDLIKDTVAPVITSNIKPGVITNNKNIHFSVTDASNTTTYVWDKNQNLLFTSKDKEFDFQLTEGINNFIVQSVDVYNNKSQYLYLSDIKLDTLPANLNAILNSEYIYSSYPQSFNVAIYSDEDLQGLSVNDVPALLVAPKTYSYTLIVNQPGSVTLNLKAYDLAGNVTVKTYSPIFNIDNIAPVISSSVSNNSFTNNNTIHISVVDNSETTTEVYNSAGQLIKTTLDKSFDIVMANQGLNSYIVKSKDRYNNEALNLSLNITYDTTAPLLTQTPAVKYFTNSLPKSMSLNFTANEQLSFASVNNQVVSLSNGNSFAYDVSVSSSGNQILNIQLKDLAGNTTNTKFNFSVIMDNTAPTIAVSDIPNLTNQNQLNININVTDESETQTNLSLNGILIASSRDKSISQVLDLTKEGENLLNITSTDEAGNIAQSFEKKIVRDTTPPILTGILPVNNSTIDRVQFVIAATSNEALLSAKINNIDVNLSADKKSITGNYYSANQGAVSLIWEVVDLAGNKTILETAVNIQQKLLVPELVSVTPSQDGQHLLVAGQISATRPNSAVKVSYGFLGLNSDEIISNADGSFKIITDLFSNANLKATDNSSAESASMSLSFITNTTISGIVMDTLGNPLPEATVAIQNTNITTKTNASGAFQINSGRTGDQTLIVDGSTIPEITTGPNRKFSQTSIAINIGIGQNNTLARPIYLQPLKLDGSQTVITANSGAVATSADAPGVSLSVPANSAVFPDGSKVGSVTIATIDSSKATIEPPKAAMPSQVVALEPSGLAFTKRADIVLPNDNDLPAGTDMIILSMNSKKGIWEVDGIAQVSEDGSSVKSKAGQGISHFSLVYAVPVRSYIEEVKNPKIGGIDISDGAMSTSLSLPYYKSLGQKVSPSLTYKSSWANPVAFVTNSFDIPTQQIQVETQSSSSSTYFTNLKFRTCYKLLGFITLKCEDNHGKYLINSENNDQIVTTSAYKPDSIKAKFYVSSLSTDQIKFGNTNAPSVVSIDDLGFKAVSSPTFTFTGLPNRSLISFAVPLKDPETNKYLETGLYPALSRFEVKLKNMTVTTISRTTKTRVDGGQANVNVSYFKKEDSKILDQVFPSDLMSNLIVQNKISSPFGRGWNLNLAQKIINPKNNLVVIEEASGQVSTYALNNTISTVLDGNTLGVSFSQVGSLNSWPKVLTQKTDSSNNDYVVELDANLKNQSTILNLGKVETLSGQLGNSLENDCATRNYTGTFNTYLYNYSYKAEIGHILKTADGNVFGTNLKEHSIFKLNNSAYTKLAGAEDFYSRSEKLSSDQVNPFCIDKFGKPCGSPTLNSTRNCSEAKIQGCPANVICKITPIPNFIDSNGIIPAAYYNGDNRSGDFGSANYRNIALNQPQSIVLSPEGDLVFADTGNNRVRKVNLSTNTVSTLVGNGANIDSGDNGQASSASIFHPRGLVYDSVGNLYISSENGYIRKVDTSGVITTFAGLPLGQGGILSNEIAANQIALLNPSGLAFDDVNNYLYVADTGNNRVVRISLDNMIASNVAGSGSCNPNAKDDNQAALNASICNPSNVGLDDQKNLIIVDSGRNLIRKIQFNSAQGSSLAFSPSANDLSTLVKNEDGTWVRTYRDGRKSNFNSLGYQISEENRLGQKIQFNYDESNKIIEAIDPVNQKLTITYSGDKISEIKDPAGKTTRFNFSNEYLSSVMFPDGSIKYFNYDASNGLMTNEINEENNKTSYTYNSYLRLSKVTDAQLNDHYLDDQVSKSISVVDTINNLSPAGFDGVNIYNKISNPSGASTYYIKDSNNLVTRVMNPKGQITQLIRDATGNLIKTIAPDLSETVFVYDPNTNDLLSKQDVSTGIVDSKKYNEFGQLVEIKDGRNNLKKNVYNATTGLLEKEQFPDGTEISYLYNSKGLIYQKTEKTPIGILRVSQFEYDQFGNVTKMTAPDNKETNYTYDNSGNVLKISTKGLNQSDVIETNYNYDDANRLVRVISPKNEITEYSYNKLGQIAEIKDPKNRITTFTYDSLGRVTSKLDPNVEGLYKFKYDSNGNMVEETLPDGIVKTYTYNELNQLTKVTLPDDVLEYAYDLKGNQLSLKNKNSLVGYSRDSLGRVVLETYSGVGLYRSIQQLSLQYDYDENSNLMRTLVNNAQEFTYQYDNLNRLTNLKNPFNENFNYTYDSSNRISQINRPGSQTDYSFFDSGLPSVIQHSSNGVTKSKFEYQYDLRNLITQKRSVATVEDYTYDSNGQVLNTSLNSVSSESYTYDPIGNRITDNGGNYVYDSNLQILTEDYQYNYLYDKRGNLIAKNPKDTTQKAYKYEYTSLNQLKRLSILDNPFGQIINDIIYEYDVLGRRFRKTVTKGSIASNVNNDFIYYYYGDNILFEINSKTNETHTGFISNTVATYTFSPVGTDDILSVNITNEGASIHKKAKAAGSYFFLKDHLGSVTDITNSSGTIVQRYQYSTFGKINKILDEGLSDISGDKFINNQFTFTGREIDDESGLYYYRARYYDPSIGRFLQQDPYTGQLGAPLSHINKYTYAANNPVMLSDPSGKSWLSDFWDHNNDWIRDAGIAIAAVAIIWASGGSLLGALKAVGSMIGGSVVTSAFQSLLQGGNFEENFSENFHFNFRLGAFALVASAALSWGSFSAGGDGIHGWINRASENYSGGATLSAGSFILGSPTNAEIGSVAGTIAQHELGRYIQYTGVMALGSFLGYSNSKSASIYLGIGAVDGGLAGLGYISPWYNSATWLGR